MTKVTREKNKIMMEPICAVCGFLELDNHYDHEFVAAPSEPVCAECGHAVSGHSTYTPNACLTMGCGCWGLKIPVGTKFKVEVQRFKTTGKYYDTSCYETGEISFYKVIEELSVRRKSERDEFIWLLTGKGHPGGHPKLLL